MWLVLGSFGLIKKAIPYDNGVNMATEQPSLLSRILFFIVATLAALGFFLVGATVFLVLLGLAFVAFLVFGIRMWWAQRQLQRRYGPAIHRAQNAQYHYYRQQSHRANKKQNEQVVIEAELVKQI